MNRPISAFGVTLVLLATACSSGPSDADYFTELETITQGLDAELDTVEASFNAGLLDIDFESTAAEQQLVTLFQDSISTTADSFADAVGQLEQLEPPDSLRGSHEDTVAAGQFVLQAYEERIDDLESIENLTGIDDYAISLSDTGARQRFTEACQELQVIADRDDVAVDLSC